MNRSDALRVTSQNPFQELGFQTRIRQLLHTHQGRDKLFKVLQYVLRLRLWYAGIDINTNYVEGAEPTRVEKNLMTTLNTRRLFRVGRFMGEFMRLHVTLIKCADLLYAPTRDWRMSAFVQFQMIVDVAARVLMLIKSVCEDIAFLAQKGFLHTNVADRLLQISAKCGLPVLAVDFFLNTLRLAQGLIYASSHPQTRCDEAGNGSGAHTPLIEDASFSLLSKYDRVDKLRRLSSLGLSPSQGDLASLVASTNHVDELAASMDRSASPDTDPSDCHHKPLMMSSSHPEEEKGSFLWDGTHESNKPLEGGNAQLVGTYSQLLWVDFELHWICVTEIKLMLDMFVALSVVQRWSHWKGAVSLAGFVSGLLSVYRVWTYGR